MSLAARRIVARSVFCVMDAFIILAGRNGGNGFLTGLGWVLLVINSVLLTIAIQDWEKGQ
jgi:hypothetical protein